MSATFPLVFSVTSGKGGVGKTNLAVNIAVSLAQAANGLCCLTPISGWPMSMCCWA